MIVCGEGGGEGRGRGYTGGRGGGGNMMMRLLNNPYTLCKETEGVKVRA